MTLATWDPRVGEQRCECSDFRLDMKQRDPVEHHHARFVHAGRFPGYGHCMTTGCRCEKFRPREER